jgi:hypothetical protein
MACEELFDHLERRVSAHPHISAKVKKGGGIFLSIVNQQAG